MTAGVIRYRGVSFPPLTSESVTNFYSRLTPSKQYSILRYMKNQCDGCAAGMPVDDHGNHYFVRDGKTHLYMGCTKHLYSTVTIKAEAAAREKE